MRAAALALRALALALALAACAVEPGPPRGLPEGDLGVFAAEAQPVLDRHCADPGCHGRPERPFAIYSPGRHRADPERRFLAEPLSEAELAANARTVAAFALEPLLAGAPVDDCLVLRKPLALGAGGCGHEGGASFRGTDDRDYRALRSFLVTLRLPEETP